MTPIRDFNPSGISQRTSIPPTPSRKGRLLTTVVVGALSGFIAVHGYTYLQRSNILPIRDVVVEGAASEAHAAEIEAYADVRLGSPLLELDLDAVRARVLEHPYVKTAQVKRLPPDAVGVRVEPRLPMATVAMRDLYIVDSDGFLFKRAGEGDDLDLPVITGVQRDRPASERIQSLRGALRVLKGYAEAGSPAGPVHEVRLTGDAGLELAFDDELVVRVGYDNLGARFARLARVLNEIQAGGRKATRVYLEDDGRPERVAVRLRPVSEMKPGTGS